MDTNAIIEAYRTRSWRALSGGWSVETVEACVAETQTGFQRRRQVEAIDASELRASLVAVHSVGVRQCARPLGRDPQMRVISTLPYSSTVACWPAGTAITV